MTDETAICSVCGRKMIFKIEDSVQGLFCDQCGWNIVTTYIAPIRTDRTVYRVYVNGISDPYLNQIRIISKIACRNYLETKRQIDQGTFLVYEGDAETVLQIIKDLNKNHIGYDVAPSFPYRIERNHNSPI